MPGRKQLQALGRPPHGSEAGQGLLRVPRQAGHQPLDQRQPLPLSEDRPPAVREQVEEPLERRLHQRRVAGPQAATALVEEHARGPAGAQSRG